jgi:uncharacterized protein (TIGR02231 family)
MIRKTVAILLILTGTLTLAAQENRDIRAEINHVTVFPDRAQVSREARITAMPGKTVCKLTGLSPYIDMQSIQVKGYGNFTILSVNHQNNYLQNLEDTPEIKKIREQIQTLKSKKEDEKAAISVLKEKADFLRANQTIMVKETSLSLEKFKSLMDLYTSNIDQVTTSTLKKERLISDYDKQVTALQKQLSDRLGKQQLPSGEITVTLQSEKQASGKLEINYVVSKAGWYPSYDLRVQDIKNPVSIIYKANVYQSTGVPWENVKLSFSNATPWSSGNIPELNPWFLDFYYPPVPVLQGKPSGVMRSKVSGVREMQAEEAVAMPALESLPVLVNKNVGETTISFDVSVPYSIPSDGKIQTVEIQRINATAQYSYFTVPKLSKQAYLTANISDWSKLSLQSGEATLYFENSYVGKSTLNVNQLKDTLTISLGSDNSILVKREKRKDFTSTRIIGSNKTVTISYLISVRNNKDSRIGITVADQIPVSSNSSISIDPVELSGGKLNSQTGEIRWKLDIGPGETKQIILTWSSKYPKDKKVILE